MKSNKGTPEFFASASRSSVENLSFLEVVDVQSLKLLSAEHDLFKGTRKERNKVHQEVEQTLTKWQKQKENQLEKAKLPNPLTLSSL